MAFPCPACGAERPSFDSSCSQCGWARREGRAAPEQDPVATPPGGRHAKRFFLAAAVIAILTLAVLISWWWQSREVGAACEQDGDCNSYKCLKLFGGELALSIRVGVCTELCDRDGDCPGEMICGDATRGSEWNYPPGDNSRRVCVPTGGRLRELLGR
ncbi:MAG: hypothetical protein JXR96_28135 [Deltaproteobacteria bacterium]|nr:hypothetical protein [Deltaproteobacteria bacterium]